MWYFEFSYSRTSDIYIYIVLEYVYIYIVLFINHVESHFALFYTEHCKKSIAFYPVVKLLGSTLIFINNYDCDRTTKVSYTQCLKCMILLSSQLAPLLAAYFLFYSALPSCVAFLGEIPLRMVLG